jgi:hypothetical protein
MKYPFHTESKPVVGEEARKLIEAIEAGESVTNERALALAKRIADRRNQTQAQANAQLKNETQLTR